MAIARQAFIYVIDVLSNLQNQLKHIGFKEIISDKITIVSTHCNVNDKSAQ